MCWPLPVQSKSAGVSAPRGATVILGCGSSNSPTSAGTSTARSIKTSQYAQQLHSGGEGMCGMCLQHHNRTPLRSWTNMAKPSGDWTINTWSTLRQWAQSFCFILKGWNNFLRKLVQLFFFSTFCPFIFKFASLCAFFFMQAFVPSPCYKPIKRCGGTQGLLSSSVFTSSRSYSLSPPEGSSQPQRNPARGFTHCSYVLLNHQSNTS